ncbi:MAG: hypothetical protein IJC26_04300 [Clostridia bacterium]|nr:hypothetical protein [Clostridia bacterium]
MKIRYDKTLNCDGGTGGFRILYPTCDGFIEYNFVHSVVPEKNCDIWRMSVVNALDDKGAFLHRLTKGAAEWEMAIRLKDRPDFIGGFNHGDEIGTEPTFILDGEEIAPQDVAEWRAFSKLEIKMDSIGFDPASPSEAVLSHRKEYVYDAEGVHLFQEVLWKKDAVLDGRLRSYLAMMPPLKHDPKDESRPITDSFAFGKAPLQKITHLPVEEKGVFSFTVTGTECAYRFTMSVGDYAPLYPNSYLALLTDNGKHMNYHKMYIAFAGGAEEPVPAGTKWQASTHYRIEKA